MPTPNRVRFIVKSVTATYTVQPIDWVVLCDPTSASFTVTLPSPTAPNVYGLQGGQSRPFLIKHSSSSINQVTVTPPSGTIDGQASIVLNARQGIEIVSDGTNFHVVKSISIATSVGGAQGTSASGAITLNGQQGVVTTESLSTAAGSTYTLTITNSSIVATSNVLVEVGYGSATAGLPFVTKVAPAAGSVVISILNLGASNPSAAAFNGSLKVQFAVL